MANTAKILKKYGIGDEKKSMGKDKTLPMHATVVSKVEEMTRRQGSESKTRSILEKYGIEPSKKGTSIATKKKADPFVGAIINTQPAVTDLSEGTAAPYADSALFKAVARVRSGKSVEPSLEEVYAAALPIYQRDAYIPTESYAAAAQRVETPKPESGYKRGVSSYREEDDPLIQAVIQIERESKAKKEDDDPFIRAILNTQKESLAEDEDPFIRAIIDTQPYISRKDSVQSTAVPYAAGLQATATKHQKESGAAERKKQEEQEKQKAAEDEYIARLQQAAKLGSAEDYTRQADELEAANRKLSVSLPASSYAAAAGDPALLGRQRENQAETARNKEKIAQLRKDAEEAQWYADQVAAYQKMQGYAAVKNQADFAEKSQYKSRPNGKTANPVAGIYADMTYVDPLYEYINGNKEVQQAVGNDAHHYKDLPEDTVKTFNYLYATEGAKAAYEYLDLTVEKDFSALEALSMGVSQPLASAAAAIGSAFDKDGTKDWYGSFLRDSAQAQGQHPVAYGAGTVAGEVGTMLAISSGIGAIPGFASLAPLAQNVASGAATMGGTAAVRNAGAAATGMVGGGDYLKDILISSIGGAVGAGASYGISSGAKATLEELGLTGNKLATSVAAGLSSAGYAAGSTGTKELAEFLSAPEDYELDAGEITQSLLTAFAFGAIRAALTPSRGTANTTQGRYKAQTEQGRMLEDITDADELKRVYHQLSHQYHPDHGGSEEIMVDLNSVYDAQKQAIATGKLNTTSSLFKRIMSKLIKGKDASDDVASFTREVRALPGMLEDGTFVGTDVAEAIQILNAVADDLTAQIATVDATAEEFLTGQESAVTGRELALRSITPEAAANPLLTAMLGGGLSEEVMAGGDIAVNSYLDQKSGTGMEVARATGQTEAGANYRLTEADLSDYMQVGERQHVRDQKARIADSGSSPVLTSPEEIRTFIRQAIGGEIRDEIRAYGRVGTALAEDVSAATDGAVSIGDYYLELETNALKHLDDHIVIDKDGRNTPLTMEQAEHLPDYIDTYDDLIDVIRRKDGSVRLMLGKKINGHSIIIEAVSKGRKSLHPVTAWQIDTDTYNQNYKPRAVGRSSTSHTTQKARQDISRPATTPVDSIIFSSDDGVKGQFTQDGDPLIQDIWRLFGKDRTMDSTEGQPYQGDDPLLQTMLGTLKAAPDGGESPVIDSTAGDQQDNPLLQAILNSLEGEGLGEVKGPVTEETGLEKLAKSDILQSGEPFDKQRIVPWALKRLEKSPGLSNNVVMLRLYAKTTDFVADESIGSPIGYDAKNDVIVYNPQKGLPYGVDIAGILFHELAHRAAVRAYGSLKNPVWDSAIRNAEVKVMERAKEIQGWFDVGGKYRYAPFLSDIFSALSSGEIHTLYSHPAKEWESGLIRSNEIFANIAAIDALGLDRDELLDGIYEAFKEIIEGGIN